MDRPSAPKRPRLSMACNLCRQRKVKCDADYPRCKNCRVRNQDCVTTDPQRPGIPGLREWIDIPERSPGIGVTSGNGVPRPQDERPVVEHVAAAVAVQRDAVSATNDESPVHHPFKTSENIEHGTNRMKVVGGTSSQCLAKSLDVFLKAAHLQPVSGVFQYGMRHSEELDIPLTPSLPPLPTQETRDRYLKAFCTRIYILYPIFDLDELRNAVTQLADSSDGFSHLSRERVPSLVSAYLIMSLGADESSQSVTRDGELYLRAATGLLSHLIVLPYVPAVQALVLFAITYRSRNQEGLGRQAIGMAIRMAYSLGIHRPAKLQQNQATAADRSLYSLIWSACCCLERMMQVDSGLPTAIAAHAPGIGPDFVPQDHHFLKWHYQLSEYQGRISQHIYNHGQLGTRSVQEILRDTAQLDRELLAWANQIPVELRPGNDIFCPADEFHIVAMLSIQYHSAMITLLAASSRLEAEVSRYCAEDPSQHRLRRGESICVASARAIAKLSVEIGDRKADSRVLSGGPFLLASIVLAIYLVKQPGSRLQAMDLQLLNACLEYTILQFSQCNPDSRFVEGLAFLYDQVVAHIRNSQTTSSYSIPHMSKSYHQPSSHIDHASNSSAAQIPLPAIHSLVGQDLSSGRPTGHQSRYELLDQRLRAPDDADSIVLSPLNQRNGYHLPTTRGAGNEGVIHPHPSGNMSDLETTEDCVSEMGTLFPFESFNVEDLWNWMLYFDNSPCVS